MIPSDLQDPNWLYLTVNSPPPLSTYTTPCSHSPPITICIIIYYTHWVWHTFLASQWVPSCSMFFICPCLQLYVSLQFIILNKPKKINNKNNFQGRENKNFKKTIRSSNFKYVFEERVSLLLSYQGIICNINKNISEDTQISTYNITTNLNNLSISSFVYLFTFYFF